MTSSCVLDMGYYILYTVLSRILPRMLWRKPYMEDCLDCWTHSYTDNEKNIVENMTHNGQAMLLVECATCKECLALYYREFCNIQWHCNNNG